MEKLQAREFADWKPAVLVCRLEAYVPGLQAGSLRS